MESGTAAPPKDPVTRGARGAISISSNQHEEITIPPCRRLEGPRRLELIFTLPSPFSNRFLVDILSATLPVSCFFFGVSTNITFFLGRVLTV